MKPLALAAASLLASCAFHVHVHEAPPPVTEAPPAHAPSHALAHARTHAGGAIVAGRVLGPHDRPQPARVALVAREGGGSYAMTCDGAFHFPQVFQAPFTLVATTEDGRIAVRTDVVRGMRDVVVRDLAPGARVEFELAGPVDARLAVFDADSRRVEDFTPRVGKRHSFVVPAGKVTLQLYGDGVDERTEHELEAGTSTLVRLGSG